MSNYKPQEDVTKFMTMCGQEVNTTPTIPSKDILLLRSKLIDEEGTEFIEAAGCFRGIDENGNFAIFTDDKAKPDLVKMYDGLVDSLYVIYGAFAALGLDAQAGWNEVQRSNMSKANPDGTITKNAFGKVIKSLSYSPADLQSVLDKQVK